MTSDQAPSDSEVAIQQESQQPSGLHRYPPITAWLPKYQPLHRSRPPRRSGGGRAGHPTVPRLCRHCGVPVLVGLYSIPLALIAYAVLGSSPHLVVGPVSTVSVLSGSLVADMTHGDPAKAVGFTSALAIGAGRPGHRWVAKLGWAAEFMSRPIVTGFVFGLVILIVLGEVPNLLGSECGVRRRLRRAWSIPDVPR